MQAVEEAAVYILGMSHNDEHKFNNFKISALK
jgi:hypothetical protein